MRKSYGTMSSQSTSEKYSSKDFNQKHSNTPFRDKSSSVFHTMMNISKVYLGMAVLTCPRAMSHTGIGLGIIGIILSGVLNWYSIYLQAEARRKFMKVQKLEEMLELEAANQTWDSIPNSLYDFSTDSVEMESIKEPWHDLQQF